MNHFLHTGGPAYVGDAQFRHTYAYESTKNVPSDSRDTSYMLVYEALAGVTVLDYFAAHTSIADFGVETAKALMGGVELPDFGTDPVASLEWWALAEAKLRFMSAKAMMRARAEAVA